MQNPSYFGKRVEHTEFLVGAGFYAIRVNYSKRQRYTKLVKRDRSGKPNMEQLLVRGNLTPLVGKRIRIKHRARAVK